jgi:glycosyltransferase involved in cell wall biosynthesis
MNIRTHTWLQDSLSWASVVTELVNSFDAMGHSTYVVSTNGMNERLFNTPNKMVNSVLGLQRFGAGKQAIDLDFTYTVPQNFPSRFLPNSKRKAAIYAFEYQLWPTHWKQFYHLANLYFPPSNFAAEVFRNNGVPADKTFVIPHGVDTAKFNPDVPKYPLKTKKAFRFVSVVAPHSRKRIDVMLKAYCDAFTANDDVCLVLKTKLIRSTDKNRQPYEVCVGDWLEELRKKHGDQMPEVEVIDQRVDNVASIYNTAQVHVTTTGSECYGIPMIESLACGLINIATNYSGQLDFLNDANSLLIDYRMTRAKHEDQYWHIDPRNQIAQASQSHTSELMLKAYREYDTLKAAFGPAMKQAVEQYSWRSAAQRILDVCGGKVQPYKPGTVRLPR